ncbi:MULTISPECIES: hypothetical protein [unclassified Paenibacillus]|uniref:hypothetical protein n=1 Tax=unclassified Paenibacillus TaxID=185978 RepID=UPI001115692C|nr:MULTISPECIES: hypothetical protein [unclassified Paenibacillus]QID16070.1 hypothetical protein CIC07_25415 [Paenibacillus sp. RUD330]
MQDSTGICWRKMDSWGDDVAKPRQNTLLTNELSSLDLAKIGLTLNVIGDLFGYFSIIKAEEELQSLEEERRSREASGT